MTNQITGNFFCFFFLSFIHFSLFHFIHSFIQSYTQLSHCLYFFVIDSQADYLEFA